MFKDVMMAYETLTDEELVEMIFEGTVVDVMAVAVLLKRVHGKVKKDG